MACAEHTPSDNPLGSLATEGVNPATARIDRMSPLDIVRLMNQEDAKVAQAVEQELPHIAQAIEVIADRLRQGGRLIYLGAGSSGRLGILDAAECPPTFNISPQQVLGIVAGGPIALAHAAEDAEDSITAGENDVAHVIPSSQDVLVGISASGRTPYVLGGVTHAKNCGAYTIGLACNTPSPLAQLVDTMIAPLVGPEVITGSTRLKAATAQKMVLNMLSTGAMILLGKTFGNLMVDVQPTNQKLWHRATTIVEHATGLDHEAAASLLQRCNGETRTAIIVGRTNVTPEVARVRLIAHKQMLHPTLASLETSL